MPEALFITTLCNEGRRDRSCAECNTPNLRTLENLGESGLYYHQNYVSFEELKVFIVLLQLLKELKDVFTVFARANVKIEFLAISEVLF